MWAYFISSPPIMLVAKCDNIYCGPGFKSRLYHFYDPRFGLFSNIKPVVSFIFTFHLFLLRTGVTKHRTGHTVCTSPQIGIFEYRKKTVYIAVS